MSDVLDAKPPVGADRAVDVDEVAAVVGASAVTVKRSIKAWLDGDASELPSFKLGAGLGRRRKVWLSDVRAWTQRRSEAERARRASAERGLGND